MRVSRIRFADYMDDIVNMITGTVSVHDGQDVGVLAPAATVYRMIPTVAAN